MFTYNFLGRILDSNGARRIWLARRVFQSDLDTHMLPTTVKLLLK